MKYVKVDSLAYKIWLQGKNVFAPVYKIDHRAMERNKYAPWGRQAY